MSTRVPFSPRSLPEGGDETGAPGFLGRGRAPCAVPGRCVVWSSLPGRLGAAGVHFAGTTFAVMWPPSCFLGSRAPGAVSAPVAPGRLLPLFLLSTPSLSSCHAGFRGHPPKPSDELRPLCWHPPAWTVLPLSRVCRLPWVSAQRSFSQGRRPWLAP